MDVNYWGPHLWKFLHTMVLDSPEVLSKEKQDSFESFFVSLKDTLPCCFCRESYSIILNKFPVKPFLDTRLGVAYWVYRLHNLVNEKLGKDKRPSFLSVIRTYQKKRVGTTNLSKKVILSAEEHYKSRADKLLIGFKPSLLNR